MSVGAGVGVRGVDVLRVGVAVSIQLIIDWCEGVGGTWLVVQEMPSRPSPGGLIGAEHTWLSSS